MKIKYFVYKYNMEVITVVARKTCNNIVSVSIYLLYELVNPHMIPQLLQIQEMIRD